MFPHKNPRSTSEWKALYRAFLVERYRRYLLLTDVVTEGIEIGVMDKISGVSALDADRALTRGVRDA